MTTTTKHELHCILRLGQQVFAPLCFLEPFVQRTGIFISCSCIQMIQVWGSKGEASPQGSSNQDLPKFTVKPSVYVLLAHITSATWVVTKVAAPTSVGDKPLTRGYWRQVSRGRVGTFGDVALSSVDIPDGLLL